MQVWTSDVFSQKAVFVTAENLNYINHKILVIL